MCTFNSLINNSVFNNCFQQKSPILEKEQPTVLEEEEQPNPTVLEKIEEVILYPFIFIKKEWSVINETRSQIGRVCRIVISQCSENPSLVFKLNRVIASVGLLAGLDLLITLDKYPEKLETFLKNIGLNDVEGILLSTISSFVIEPCGALSSLITFVSSIVSLGSFPTVVFFGLIAQPLGLILTGYSALKGIYDLVFLIVHWIKIPSKDQGLEKLKTYLNVQTGITEKEIEKITAKYPEDSEKKITLLKAKKINILSRQTDKKIVTIMINLQAHLERNPDDEDTAQKALKDIHTLMRRKVVVNTLSTLAAVALKVVMFAALFFQLSPIVTPVVGLVKGSISVGKHFYENYGFDRGLNCPEFLKASA